MMYRATEEHRNALKEFEEVRKELDLLYKSNRMHKPSQSIHLANKLGFLKENFQHFKKYIKQNLVFKQIQRIFYTPIIYRKNKKKKLMKSMSLSKVGK